MIQNSPTGGRTILYSNRFAPRGRDADNMWPDVQSFALVTLVTFPGEPLNSYTFIARLKDGNNYQYYYGGHPAPTTDADLAVLNSLTMIDPIYGPQPWRGERFNS